MFLAFSKMPKISLALALIECDIRCMKDEISKPAAWAVPVWTLRMGGGQPMLVMYAAIYGDKEMAIDAVKSQYLADGDEIGDVGPLSEETVKALGAAPGQVWML